MDTAATKADFARTVTESHRIMAKMRAEARLNCRAIDQSRRTIGESWYILGLSAKRANG